jgi:phosphatidylserine decarboxylase
MFFFIIYSNFINLISKMYIPVFLRKLVLHIVAKYFLKIKNINDFNLKEYKNIKAFFIRKIKIKTKDLEKENNILSPCEGKIINLGLIENIKKPKDKKLKIKQSSFDYNFLLDNDTNLINKYNDANFIVVYLAPHNYHRFHAPLTGNISYLKKVKGFSYPVNPNYNKNLSLNERVILEIDNILLVFIGASGVREIHISKSINETINIGQELGYFGLGSTIIVISKNFKFSSFLLNKNINVLEKLSI